jgi:hypothetical protein
MRERRINGYYDALFSDRLQPQKEELLIGETAIGPFLNQITLQPQKGKGQAGFEPGSPSTLFKAASALAKTADSLLNLHAEMSVRQRDISLASQQGSWLCQILNF